MRYMTEAEALRNKVNLDVANISRTGSVKGMQQKFSWPEGGQLRVGAYIYNIGVGEVNRLRRAGVLKGEK